MTMVNAIPKPQKHERKRAAIDTAELALPKPSPARDADYRAYVRKHDCAIRGRAGHRCYGAVEAAHIGTAGLGLKSSDYATVPLCIRAHEGTQHQIGWPAFMVRFDFNPWHTAFVLLEKWHRRKAQ
jgi:hypothetical protein